MRSGLGNIFGGLLRNVLVPRATSATKSGIDVAWQDFGESARKHVTKGMKWAAEGIVSQKVSGKPVRKRRRPYNDIFDFHDW